MPKWLKIASTVAVVVILVAAGLVVGINLSDDASGATPDNSQYNIIVATGGCNKDQVAAAKLVSSGFQPDQFVLGADKIDWKKSVATEHGDGSFTSAKKTVKEWTKWLNSNDANAKLVREHVIQQAGVKKLDPNGWIAYQLTVASNWGGNTSVHDGKVKSAGTRHSKAGDAGWMYVNLDDCQKVFEAAQQNAAPGSTPTVTAAQLAALVRAGVVRLGCGNPQTEMPTPAVPTTPSKPSTPTTPSTRPPTTTTTLTPKNPTKNIDRNPNVPPQVTKTGPSPDNQTEIQKGPTAPHDTPTGCQGPCPTTQPQPKPVNGGGTTCGQDGQPACVNSQPSTPPTTTPPNTIPGGDNGHTDIDP